MSINVNRQTAQNKIVIEQNKTQKQQNLGKQKEAAVGDVKDSVQFTSQALNLNKTQGPIEPKVNSQRIEALKSSIINGEYKINTERLAEKLSQFEGDINKAFS